MSSFKLDRVLEADSMLVSKLGLCQLRLMNDSRWPWLLLIPQRPEAEEIYHLTPSQVGFYFGAPALGYFCGNFVAARLSVRVGINRMILYGTTISTGGLLIPVALHFMGLDSAQTFFGSVTLVGLGNGMTMASGNSGMLSGRPHLAGSASGVGGAVMLAGGAGLADLAGTAPHRSRLAGRDLVAGAHALSELPDEITTAGRGQIRALVINSGNPVVSGPDGAKLDRALADLDLLVAVDFVQRESHRHAHWLLPAVHWLERDDLLAFTSNLHDEPYVHYGVAAVEPPPLAREEWRIFTDLALAMDRPLFGVRGMNAFVRATRRLARVARRPQLEFGPYWVHRLLVATSRKVNGRRLSWRAVVAHPHGWVLGPREFGRFRGALRTADKKVHVAPPEFVARTRELLDQAPPSAPSDFPFQLANRRQRHSMNSWLNDLPGLHPAGKGSQVVIHPDDARQLGIGDGDLVRVASPVGQVELTASVHDQPRRGVVIIDHGWGSRVFDPVGGAAPLSYGVNRNLLVDGGRVDPISQTAALNSSYVSVERVG